MASQAVSNVTRELLASFHGHIRAGGRSEKEQEASSRQGTICPWQGLNKKKTELPLISELLYSTEKFGKQLMERDESWFPWG